MKISEEQIERANSVNLPMFLISNGFQLKKVGKEYQWKEHDSLHIKDNAPGENGKWFRFSTDEGGDNINFVQQFMNKSFIEAVEMLNGERYDRDFISSHIENIKSKEIRKADISILENADSRRVFGYLCGTRGLDYELISELVKDGKIVQEEKKGNAVFKIFYENSTLVGAEKVGTSTEKKFKSIATGSSSGYGFEIVKGNGKSTLFFESAIDLLSYLQMNGSRLDNHRLVSMMGVKPSVVIDTMKRYGISSQNVYLCSDNDDAGNQFADRLMSEYPQMNRIIPEDRYKDWNDMLRDIPVKDAEEVKKVTTYGNKIWNDATDNRDKSLISMNEDTFNKLKYQLDTSSINYFAYTKDSKTVMAVNDKDLDWLKQIAGTDNLPVRKSDVEHIPPQKNIIGNAEYRYIPNKQYVSADSDTALKMAEIMMSRNIQFSGRVYPNGKATLTVNSADLSHVQTIQQSIVDMRKQFARETKADEIIGNKAYRDIRQRQYYYSKLKPEQYKEVQPYLDTNAQYSGLIRNDKVIFTVEKEDSTAFHRALENAQREVDIIHALKESGIDDYRLKKMSAVIHRFAVEDIHERLDNFFTPQLNEQQFDKMLALMNDYLSQSVAERYGEYSGLNAILDFKGEIDRMAELEEYFSEHSFSDEQKAVISEMFAEDSSKTNIEAIDETFAPDEIREYYSILHNQLDAGDIAEFLANRNKPELTEKEQAFLDGDIAPFMAKAVLAWDEIESIGYRMFEDGYNDKYFPHDNSIYGNGLKETVLADMVHRMNDGEDIRKELAMALLGTQGYFTTTHDNEFNVEYGDNAVTARYENAERQVSYEELGDAFLNLIRNEHDEIVKDHTMQDLLDTLPGLSEETANQLITAFSEHTMHGWKSDSVKQNRIKSALYDILDNNEQTEKAFASIAEMKYNFKAEQEEKSPVHFGLLGNGITAYDISRTDSDTNDYVTIAHISPEGVINLYDDSISSSDLERIKSEATTLREKFMAEWETLDTAEKLDMLYDRADTETMLNIGKENLTAEEKIDKYMPFVIFGEGERPEPEKTDKKPTVDDLAVGDVILYDGKRREIENISKDSIMMKDIDSPDFGGVLIGTSDVFAYKGWQEDMNAKGFEILKKAETIEENKDLGPVTMRKIGDFYEMYGKNAQIGADVLDLHLTTKNGEDMVGFPDSVKDDYSEKLKDAGYSVLIEQAYEINPPQNSETLMSDVSEIEKTIPEEVVNPVTIVFNGDDSGLDEIKDMALSLGATCTLISSGLVVDTYENHKDELLSSAYELGVFAEIRGGEPADLSVEEDVPLFNDADVIEEIEKSEKASDNKPFWETPNDYGEQLSLFGDSVPLAEKEKPKQEEKFSEGLFVGNVNRYTALHDEIMRGTGFQDGKFRVKQFYDEKKPTNKEFADFLKNEHGTGGHSNDGEVKFVDHDSKGMFFTLDSGEKFKFTWSDVAEMTAGIIDKGEYITQEDIDRRIRNAKFELNEGINADYYDETSAQRKKKDREILKEYSNTETDKEKSAPISLSTELEITIDTVEIGDKFKNRLTGEISEIVALTGALPWYTEDCTIKRESDGFVITENIPYSKILDSNLYDYLGKDVAVREKADKSSTLSAENQTEDKKTETDKSETHQTPSEDIQKTVDTTTKSDNFTITDDSLGNGGAKTKFNNNIAAIETLKRIESDNLRRAADMFKPRLVTDEEKETLSKYVGWGGIPQAFDKDNPSWEKEYTQLKELLADSEYSSARASVLDAFFTSPKIIDGIYEALGNFGFEGGNVLEPAMGVGNFFGRMPEEMKTDSKLYGMEIDSISGRIAKQLYPDADIAIKGFEKNNF